MYGYCWEKIDLGHYWDLKGQVGVCKGGFDYIKYNAVVNFLSKVIYFLFCFWVR